MPPSSIPKPRSQPTSSLAGSMTLPADIVEQSSSNPFAPPLQSQTTSLASSTLSKPTPEITDQDANMDVPIDSWAGATDSKRNGKQRALDSGEDESSSKVGKARTLGGDRRRESVGPVKEIRAISFPMDVDATNALAGPSTVGVPRLRPPVLRNLLSVKIEDKESDVFEGTNSEDRTSEIVSGHAGL